MHELVLLLFLSAAVPFINSADPCQTPNGQKGNCVPINQCQSLYSHFLRDFIPSETATYIRRSHCGFIDVYPKVCCPDGSAVPDTKKLIATSDLLSENCGIVTTNKIYGGEIAGLDEFPWMALLQFQFKKNGPKSFQCGGVLINRRYVLTAAHCVLPSLVNVYLGEYNTETEIDCIDSKYGKDCAPKSIVAGIEEKIVYESYSKNDTNRYHDVGLLRLDRDIEFNDFIKPVCLPLAIEELYESYLGHNLTVSGWGFTENGFRSNLLRKVQVPVTETPSCQDVYRKKFTGYENLILDAGQICAGGELDKDSCKADSGGPLMTIKKVDGEVRSYVIGVVSFGPIPCGQYQVPGVYTKIAKYVKWIVDQLKP